MQDVYRRADITSPPKASSPAIAFLAIPLALGLPVALFVAANVDRHSEVIAAAGLLATLVGAALCARVIASRKHDRFARIASGIALLVGLFMAQFGFVFALIGSIGFTRGRQLRKLGKLLLPEIGEKGAAWTDQRSELPAIVPADVAPALAEQWRENGKTEHASVAAFARLSADLIALGAPPELLEAANRDALDEIEHAKMCFSLATDLDGNRTGPLAFPAARTARTLPSNRTLALAVLAVDSLVDGALHEGVSAAVIAELARRCRVPRIEEMLRSIARDEGRHAAHGWDVAMWCVAEGGEPVRRALLGALDALPETMHSPLPDAANDGAWEKYGIHGRALEASAWTRVRGRLVERVTSTLRASPKSSASRHPAAPPA